MSDLKAMWAALSSGDYAQVLAAAKRLLQAQRDHREALLLLAAASFETGDLRCALQAYQRLAVLEPADSGHWQNLGTVQRELGDWPAAKASYEMAATRGADDAGFHCNYGLLLADLGEADAARARLAMAYAADPLDAVIALAHAGLLCRGVRQQEAEAVLRGWRTWRELSEAQLVELSGLFMELGEMNEAEAVLRLALTLDAEHTLARLRFAGLLERLNRLEAAEDELRRAAEQPLDAQTGFEAEALAAKLAQRRGRHSEAAARWQAIQTRPEAAASSAELQFSLARSLDMLKRNAETFAALEAAHAAQLEHLRRYTPKAVTQPEPLRIADYSADGADIARWPAATAVDGERDPVFVVAFPRSGTTLLEQVLDAHPALCSMDEQPYLQQAIGELQAAGLRYPESLAGLDEATRGRIRAGYFARVRQSIDLPGGQRLVDKNPLNLLRLAAIRRLFPAAHVVLVIRHPCDVILSCYMQHFRAPEFAMLCRSLPALVEGYCKAFEFWYAQQALLRANVMELRYERFVEALPDEARRLTDFLGLDWDQRLLDPARHARERGYISTPSYSQVVRPVNREAVNRWHRQAGHFAPLMPLLKPWLDRWGYEGLPGQNSR